MTRKTIVVAVATALLTVCGAAQAAHITVFNALLDGDQANMGLGTGSTGTGAATMTFNSDTNEFSWFVAWQDLIGTVTVAHFHGPAEPGMNAGVEVAIDAMSNPSIGSAILSADQASDLFAGLWYINIHSTFEPGGEIRGQVLQVSAIPLPAAAWLLASAVAGLGLIRRRKRNTALG